MRCPFCGQNHPDNTKFCPETGNKIEKSSLTCPSCGRTGIPLGSNFCPDCRYCFNENYARQEAQGTMNGSGVYRDFVVNGVSFRMMRVEGGTFRMGATSEQGADAIDNEKPAHIEQVGTYHIGQTVVTQELWQAVMGSNPSYFKGPKRPVESVSWKDCQDFIQILNSMTGESFRLTTEAEWEYAARGGKSGGTKYAGSDDLDDVAWYWKNSGDRYLSGTDNDWDWDIILKNNGQTHDVATKRANGLGIYDMSGNVWELTSDLWCENYSEPREGSSRVYRGGCWGDYARGCRVSSRFSDDPDYRDYGLGLRLAL